MDGKILIVDDNEDVLFALNLLLEPYVEKIKFYKKTRKPSCCLSPHTPTPRKP